MMSRFCLWRARNFPLLSVSRFAWRGRLELRLSSVERLRPFDQKLQIFSYSFRGVVLTAITSIVRQLLASDQRNNPRESMAHIGHYTRCNTNNIPMAVV